MNLRKKKSNKQLTHNKKNISGNFKNKKKGKQMNEKKKERKQTVGNLEKNAFKPKESSTSDSSFLSVMGVGRR